MKLKRIEARIIMYLSQVDDILRSVYHIERKLEIEYFYLCYSLRKMARFRLIHKYKIKGSRQSYYCLMERGIGKIKEAKKILEKK